MTLGFQSLVIKVWKFRVRGLRTLGFGARGRTIEEA